MFPRRVADYGPAWLDELAARGEIVWVGAGAGGVGGGRVAIYFREDAPLLGPPPADPAPGGRDRRARCAPRSPGARASGTTCWWPATASREEVFTALWALVWAGEVTNDLWLPLRGPTPPAGADPAGHRGTGGPAPRGRRPAARRRPSPAGGRWPRRLFADAPPADERRRALAELLVERHGVLTRSATLSEGVPGRIRRGVPGPQRHGDARRLPARLLRRGPRRRAVRVARRRRAAARPARSAARRPAPRGGARRGRPGAAVRRRGAVAPARGRGARAVAGLRGDGRAGGRPAGPLPGARRPRPPDVREPRTTGPSSPRSRRWPTGCGATAVGAPRSSASTASRCSARPLEAPLAAAGFRADLRAMVLRA